jgi:RNA polymerase sigma factor (sigma-70 family)
VTNDEICDYARDCAQVFCRERKINEQEADDYVQEACVAALEAAASKPAVNKSLISQRVKWSLTNYMRREANEGFGSKHVNSPEHVSLAETVNGAYDEDGEPVTYGDALVYEDPPQGFGDPMDELEREVDQGRMLRAVKALSEDDQRFVEVAMLSGLTQREAGKQLGVSSSAVQQRMKTIVKRLQAIML